MTVSLWRVIFHCNAKHYSCIMQVPLPLGTDHLARIYGRRIAGRIGFSDAGLREKPEKDPSGQAENQVM